MTNKWMKFCGFSLLALGLTDQSYAASTANKQVILSVPDSSSAANAITLSAEEAMSEVMVKLNHLQLLANQAVSGVKSSSQLAMLNSEFQADKHDIAWFLQDSTINNVTILNGGTLSSEGKTYLLQPFTSKDLIPSNDSIDTVAGAKQAQLDLSSASAKLDALMPNDGSSTVSPLNPSSAVVLTINNRTSGELAFEREMLKNSISALLGKMSDLATQVATGNYSSDQMSDMNHQFNLLQADINRTVSNTQFNQIALFANNKIKIDDSKTIGIPYMSTKVLGIKDLDLYGYQDAWNAVPGVNGAMVNISNWFINGEFADGNIS